MQTKLLSDDAGLRTFAIVFDKDDEFPGPLQQFATRQGMSGAYFTGVGAFSSATLGYFDRRSMSYKEIPVAEQVEVLTLTGNIASKTNGEIKVHAHVVVGAEDGSTRGGHVLEARVWPTLELVLEEAPALLRRRSDAETGLALLDIEEHQSRAAGQLE